MTRVSSGMPYIPVYRQNFGQISRFTVKLQPGISEVSPKYRYTGVYTVGNPLTHLWLLYLYNSYQEQATKTLDAILKTNFATFFPLLLPLS